MNRKQIYKIGYFNLFVLMFWVLNWFAIINWNINYNIQNAMDDFSDLTVKESVYFLIIIEFFGMCSFIVSIFFIFRLQPIKSIIFGILGYFLILIPLFLTNYILFDYQDWMQLGLFEDSFNEYNSKFLIYGLIIVNILLFSKIILIISFSISIRNLKMNKNLKEKLSIKKIILDLGTQHTRLQIKEIAEISKIDRSSIINVVREMIANKEIYANYFKSSNFVAFNQQANIDEIDNLMATYKVWEEKNIEKK